LRNQRLEPRKPLARTKLSKIRKLKRQSKKLKLRKSAKSVNLLVVLEVTVGTLLLTLTSVLSLKERDARPKILHVLKNSMKSDVLNLNSKESNL
jgi:hypothetical protein